MPRRRRRSGSILGGRGGAPLDEELIDERETSEVGAHPVLELLACHQDDAVGCLHEGENSPLVKSGALAQLGRDHQAAPVSHLYGVRTTHVAVIPLTFADGKKVYRVTFPDSKPSVKTPATGMKPARSAPNGNESSAIPWVSVSRW